MFKNTRPAQSAAVAEGYRSRYFITYKYFLRKKYLLNCLLRLSIRFFIAKNYGKLIAH